MATSIEPILEGCRKGTPFGMPLRGTANRSRSLEKSAGMFRQRKGGAPGGTERHWVALQCSKVCATANDNTTTTSSNNNTDNKNTTTTNDVNNDNTANGHNDNDDNNHDTNTHNDITYTAALRRR